MNIFPNKPKDFRVINPRPGTMCLKFKNNDNPGDWDPFIYILYYIEVKGKSVLLQTFW